MTRALLSCLIIGLVLPACNQTTAPAVAPASVAPSAPVSAADVAYCNQLGSLYERYGSAQDYRGEDFDVSVAEAINQCNSGNPDAGIATLSRLLRDAAFTVPPRPAKT
jgi:hypothetical protein